MGDAHSAFRGVHICYVPVTGGSEREPHRPSAAISAPTQVLCFWGPFWGVAGERPPTEIKGSGRALKKGGEVCSWKVWRKGAPVSSPDAFLLFN